MTQSQRELNTKLYIQVYPLFWPELSDDLAAYFAYGHIDQNIFAQAVSRYTGSIYTPDEVVHAYYKELEIDEGVYFEAASESDLDSVFLTYVEV